MAELLNYRLLVDGFPSITQGLGPRPWPKAKKGLVKGQKRIGQRPKRPWPKAKKALAKGQSPPQELEVSPRSGLYLLVNDIFTICPTS